MLLSYYGLKIFGGGAASVDGFATDGRLSHIRGNRVAAIENDDRVSSIQENSRVAATAQNLRLVAVDGKRVVVSSENNRIIVVED